MKTLTLAMISVIPALGFGSPQHGELQVSFAEKQQQRPHGPSSSLLVEMESQPLEESLPDPWFLEKGNEWIVADTCWVDSQGRKLCSSSQPMTIAPTRPSVQPMPLHPIPSEQPNRQALPLRSPSVYTTPLPSLLPRSPQPLPPMETRQLIPPTAPGVQPAPLNSYPPAQNQQQRYYGQQPYYGNIYPVQPPYQLQPPPCFIATAAFGSPLAEEVIVFRVFRDEYLLTNPIGRRFVEVYYEYSPLLADYIQQHETIKVLTRAVLRPIAFGIQHPLRLGVIIFSFLCLLIVPKCIHRKFNLSRSAANFQQW